MLTGADKLFIPGTTAFDYEKLDEVRVYLRDFRQVNLVTLEDHKEYLQLVSKFRTLIESVTRQNGDRFLETIKRLLSVGDDGLYTNRMRFLFELIQNVDDCDYELGIEPQLTIDFNVGSRKLILRYNEMGFTPRNVFSITGIAEEAKNIDEKKLQIGEKGIGFKSVFGVANSVLIRSGCFSFRLNRDRFTVPIPEYTCGFSGIKGTELTLEFDSDETLHSVMNSVVERYNKDNALFTQNPIVFLNKLKGLEFKVGNEQLLSFSVMRPPLEKIAGSQVSLCRGMTLSLHRKGRPDRSISGTCYMTTVRYTKEDCQSRYGMNTRLGVREMKMEAFFPDPSHVIGNVGRGPIEHGLMYSFLPTQVELEVPIICHVPFKLDASREYVDSQFRNAWFYRTIMALSEFIHRCYCLQAINVRESIIAYVPKYSRNFFASKNNAKMDELLRSEYGLDGDALGRENIFYCSDGKFHAANEVESFVECEEIEQPLEILRLCGIRRPFFRAPAGFFPGGYNMPYVDYPYNLLFLTVFKDVDVRLEDIRKAVEIVKKRKPGLFQKVCKDIEYKVLSANHLHALSEVGELRTLSDTLIQRVRDGQHPNLMCCISGEVRSVFDLIDENGSIGYDDMGDCSAAYFREINGCCIVLGCAAGDNFCVLNDKVCVVMGDDPASGLIDLCQKLDPDSLFSVRLKMKKASAMLDTMMDTDNPREFLKQLRHIRMASKVALGERAYKSYLDIIQKSGRVLGGYVNELLQNADDCEYTADVVPSLEISVDACELVFKTNEVGFKACNVRAITAIGESTKNILFGEHLNKRAIGEKGVGFKSIFAIADFVEIHSGEFDFSINADAPTIPCLIKESTSQNGTLMRLKLKKGFKLPKLDEQNILDLCVCLRNLKRLKLLGHEVRIEDDGISSRRVTIDSVTHEFLIYEHEFEIGNARALEERNVCGKRHLPKQKIRFYVPLQLVRFEYPLYCGLPTQSTTCAPIIVDAPFALTTARDAVVEESLWNRAVLENIYVGIVRTAELVRERLRINVLHLFGVERVAEKADVLEYRMRMFKGVGERFLNSFPSFIDNVRCANIIPVKNGSNAFLSPRDERLRMFPMFLMKVFDADAELECPFERVDFSGRLQSDHLRDALRVLKVRELDERELWHVVDHLGSLSEWMAKKDFRDGVYAFLRKLKNVELATDYPIVPVVISGETKFVCESDGQFFFSEERRISTEEYYIIDTKIMDSKLYEDIFGNELREMNAVQELELYCNRVCKYLINHTVDENYAFIIEELKGGNSVNLQLRMPLIRSRCKDRIPLKNRNGEILCKKMFVMGRSELLLRGRILRSILVDSECSRLAELLECQPLSAISYRDLPYEPWKISREDVVDIKDGNIEDKENILLLAVKDGRISEDCALEFGLTMGLASDVDDRFDFPVEPLKNPQELKKHIQEAWNNPIQIVCKQVMRAIDFCVPLRGREFELSSREARLSALCRYSPYGRTDVCFCQMCRRVKRMVFVEANCIERKPRYYFPELRLTLCLECSKKFELLRNNRGFYENFIRKLIRFTAPNNEANVFFCMPMQDNKMLELMFTRKHFAEIQEILRTGYALAETNRKILRV